MWKTHSVSVEGFVDLGMHDNAFRPTNDQVCDGDEVRLFLIGFEVGKAMSFKLILHSFATMFRLGWIISV